MPRRSEFHAKLDAWLEKKDPTWRKKEGKDTNARRRRNERKSLNVARVSRWRKRHKARAREQTRAAVQRHRERVKKDQSPAE